MNTWIIDSGNGLVQIRRQAIIWTNDGLVWCHTRPQYWTWPQWANELLCNVTSPNGKQTPPVDVVAKENFQIHFIVWKSFSFSLGFVSKGPVNYLPGLVEIRAWRWSCDKPWSELLMSLRAAYGLHGLIHTPNTPPHVMDSSVQQRIVPKTSHTKSELPDSWSSTHLAF